MLSELGVSSTRDQVTEEAMTWSELLHVAPAAIGFGTALYELTVLVFAAF